MGDHVIKHNLVSLGTSGLYFTNCDTLGSALFGALEVFSRSAVQVFAKGKARCKFDLHWKGWGEDYFMRKCLSMLGVRHQDDFKLLSDLTGMCTQLQPPRCNSAEGSRAAFHPFKNVRDYMACLEEAQDADRMVQQNQRPPEIHT